MSTDTPGFEGPLVVVTCGPAVAPIDSVRCITNGSTGELGVLLAESLARAGWLVRCYKGASASFRDPVHEQVRVIRFSTNAQLLALLRAGDAVGDVRVVFHAAALSDYEVASVEAGDGTALGRFAKVPSRCEEVRLTLRAAPKVLPELGAIFERARIVGWKLEYDGDRTVAVEKAERQVAALGTALSVVNGPAYGDGFGVWNGRELCAQLPSKAALCEWLTAWAGSPGPVR